MIGELAVIPRKVVDYRGSRLEEMDLDAVLRRRPKLALVDELAQTNGPGSGKNAKRWQDGIQAQGELDAVHVVVSDVTRSGDRKRMEKLHELATDIGARWHEIPGDDPARAIASFARQNQITQIVIGVQPA